MIITNTSALTRSGNSLYRVIRYCLAIVLLSLSVQNVQAAPLAACKDNPSSFNIISHDLKTSFCELCSVGEIHIIVSNVTSQPLTDIEVTETLPPGLEYVNNSTTANGGGVGNPFIAGSDLTWTSAEITDFVSLAGSTNAKKPNEIEIVFQVRVKTGLTQESLVLADRSITASTSFDFCPADWPRVTHSTGINILPINEPLPSVRKLGRNVDAGQGNKDYQGIVYGNINDDVIWSIEIRNTGKADMQDLIFSDLMDPGNMTVNYACPTENAATAVANNNGVDPGGTDCVSASNSIIDFRVDDPFGKPRNDEPGSYVDVPAKDSALVFLVGKITSSCVSPRDNSVFGIEWGCEVDAPDGGISATSNGDPGGSDTATLTTLVENNRLQVVREISGTNLNQPVGSKGTVTLTITNNTRGSIKNIHLRDLLPTAPAEYVVDPTFTPTIVTTPAFGTAYPGMADTIVWTNQAGFLANTAPEFDLTSNGVTHPIYTDQFDMLRHGDVAVVTFRIILVNPTKFDLSADIDVVEENTGDGTDPVNNQPFDNQLFVDFEQFCDTGVLQQPVDYPFIDSVTVNPEDLDVTISNSLYVLTNDASTPLQVQLTNNGGHDAADYYTYVSFGEAMNVDAGSLPAGCVLTSNPPPRAVWVTPAAIPGSATVYQCTGAAIAPGPADPLIFNVTKNLVAVTDDLTFRADVVGEITLSDGTPLVSPAPNISVINNLSNNYSLDGIRSRVLGFNLIKTLPGNCAEDNPPPLGNEYVTIGEDCTFHIEAGGWFGFETPGFTLISVENVLVTDRLPDGQGYISHTYNNTGFITAPSVNNGITLSSLDEGNVTWGFNPSGQEITVKDEFFRVDLTSRLLNDPVDTSAAPNSHGAISTNIMAASFDAVFDSRTITVDELANVPGYPIESLRRQDLTVTEPSLTTLKEVCNEDLNGVGPTCSPFINATNVGDTNDSYIYKITITNEAASGGVQRAPAYSLISTDALDSTDLMLIVPFASDGLDNDADGLIDGADLDGEGSISDNIVNNGTPAVITFSHSHSTALQRLDPGGSVQIYYRVDPDDAVAPLQTLTNSVATAYDSLFGDFGNQNPPQLPNSETVKTNGRARLYETPAVEASVRIIALETQPKQILSLAHTTLSVAPQKVAIGEEIEYKLTTLIPVARLEAFVIRDELPAGIRCIEAPDIDLDAGLYAAAGFSPGGSFTPTCTSTGTNDYVEWNFGNQKLTTAPGTRFNFPVTFIAQVENTSVTNSGDVLGNGDPATAATATYVDDGGNTVVLNFGQVDVVLTEPQFSLSKSFAVANSDAGDVLTVTVTATNTGTGYAYNLEVLDDLAGMGLTYVGNLGGSNIPDIVDTGTFGANSPVFKWDPLSADFEVAPGAVRTFTFDVVVDLSVQPYEILDNSIDARWTSLPGQSTALNATGWLGVDGGAFGLRKGWLPNAGDSVNDYEVSASDQTEVLPLTMTKTDLNTGLDPEVGALKHFEIEIDLPEGTTNTLVVSDLLALGSVSYYLENNASYDVTYTFQGIASINGFAPSEDAFFSFPGDGLGGMVSWTIGRVVTDTEDDLSVNAIAPKILINYYARINNDLATNTGSTLQNRANVNYMNGETGGFVSLLDTTAAITVQESSLTAAKTVANVTLSKLTTDPVSGGDILEYVVTLTNTGNSTAWDVNIRDTLPASLELYASFTPTALINGSAVTGFVATPMGSPAGPLIWGRGKGDNSLDIPQGQSLVLTYRTLVNGNVEVGSTVANRVAADWTSLDGDSSYERTGAGCPTFSAPDDHCVGPVTTSVSTTDTNTLTKTVSSDTYAPADDATVRVGDVITYQLSLNLQEGLTRNVVVQDVLPSGMTFVDIASINGDTLADYTSPGAGTGSNFGYAAITTASLPAAGASGTLSFTLGDITNDPLGDATTDSLLVVYRARVQENDPATIPQALTTALGNTATLGYVDGLDIPVIDPLRLESSAAITALQPLMDALSKTDRNGLVSGVSVNVVLGIMSFQIKSCNTTGLAPAYSVQVVDVLASQLDESSIAGPVNGAGQPDVYINGALATAVDDYTYTAPAARGGTLDFRLITPVNPGQCVVIDYDIGFYTDFGANQTWNNSATVNEYYSLPSLAGQLYPALTPVIFEMNNTADVVAPLKTLLSPPPTGEVTIGEELVYQIKVPATVRNAAMHDVVITDTLDASLIFVSATDESGNSFVITNNITLPTGVSLAISQIPAGQQAVIELTARVNNVAGANAGVIFGNTASYSYADTSGGITIAGGSDTTDTTLKIVEPLVTGTKAVENVTNAGNPPVAGDTLRYTLTFTAFGGGVGDNLADAFDISIEDNLSLGLAYSGGVTVDGVGNTMAAPGITGDGISTAQTLIWDLATGTADIDITEGSMVTVTYEVLVLDNVLPGQSLTNTAVGQWTSLDGASANERNGSASPAHNDYLTGILTTTLTTPDTNTITKSRLGDTWITADANVRVGDIVEYELRLNLQEGTTGSVVITDELPQGLAFEAVASINGDASAPYSQVSPFTHLDMTGPPVVSGDPSTGLSTVTWTLGDIVNAGDGDPLNNDFVITYYARVLDGALAQTNSTSLTNDVTFNYSIFSGTATRISSQLITLLQPDLSVTKSAVPAGGDAVLAANELIDYTVDIVNSGLAPAYDVVLQDVIPVGLRNGTATITTISIELVSGGALANLSPTYDPDTGIAIWDFDTGAANAYTIPAGDTLRIVYRVQAEASIGASLVLTNAAQVTSYYSFDDEATPVVSGVSGVREVYGPTNIATTTLITAGINPLLKDNPAITNYTIGEPFTYRITVPDAPIGTAISDVRVLDNLLGSAADLEFVLVEKITGTQPWTPVNTGTSTSLVIEDTTNGIDIPAGEQVEIDITVRLSNTATNIDGLLFPNIATYTYNQTNDDDLTRVSGGGASTTNITVIEAQLTLLKTVANVTSGKLTTDPVTGGDTLEYVVTLSNTGNSTAWDANIVDTLPATLGLDTGFTPTALINGSAVAGFVSTPAGSPAGPLNWGRGNGDNSLDIPQGQSLVLTYRTLVNGAVEVGATVDNSVAADWTSLDGDSIHERTGAGCPTFAAPNDYCVGPVTTSVLTADTNTLTKTVLSDTYAPVDDATVRVGDVITYQLSLNLQEGLTRNVAVQDVLPSGMTFVDIVSINGDTAADYTSPGSGTGSNFSYAAIAAASLPVSGASGTLSFTLGDITNDPFGDATTDSLLVVYRARVQENVPLTIAQTPTTALGNTATLGYVDGAGSPVTEPIRLESSAAITALQPLMDGLSKTDRNGLVSGVLVNVVSDIMSFQIKSCNTGLAPAYSVEIVDVLASQLNETSIAGPLNGAGQPDVYINGALATAPDDYTYAAPAARGGTLDFRLITPVIPGQCVVIDYDIGFYTDFGANQTWNNSATVNEYYSLPSLAGQLYPALTPVIFEMNNTAAVVAPLKTLLSPPPTGEVTIGEELVYQIKVPATVRNAAMHDVVITDTLDASLIFVSATDESGNSFVITNNITLPTGVSLAISQIPAGQQAVIELTARVNNVAGANAGVIFGNTASYSYADTSGGITIAGGSDTTDTTLKIVEPLVTGTKAVANVTNAGNPPVAGDTLRYTLTFTAFGGGVGDNLADAFDISIKDNLSLGLAYSGGVTVDGVGNTMAAPGITGDGISTAQTLIWDLATGTADIDITEGNMVTVTYEVLVLDNVLPGQSLTNTAVGQWTSLDGASANERNGSASPAHNDYLTGILTTTLTTPDTNTIAKSRLGDTWITADANVRVGDIVEYELRLNLQEGTTGSVVITDELPQGLAFEAVASINGDASAPYSLVSPFTHGDIPTPGVTGNPATGLTTVTWTVGDIVNAGDGDPLNNDFVIVYYARVIDGALAQVNTTGLTNNVTFNYANVSGTATKTSSQLITLLQPNLSVTKSATPADGDAVLAANELINYTVDIINSGLAPAYDVVLQDVIPVGLRNGTATITTISIELVSGGALANLAPTYDPVTGIAIWDFDTGVANAYTIPVGDTLRVTYQVQAEAGIGASLTLVNSAQVTTYYSFDDEATPVMGGVSGIAEIYGPSNIATATLTTPAPGALLKENTTPSAAPGEPFTYRITVPAVKQDTALYDVRILDDLGLSVADLEFVSVAKISGSQPFTPVNSGTLTSLEIEDTTNGIDVPAGDQVVLEITVVLANTATNVEGLLFSNTATYTLNQINNDDASQLTGLPSTTADMSVAEPLSIVLQKTGPLLMRLSVPQAFTLDVQNTGNSTAWDLVINDLIPNPDPGGMCDVAPNNFTAQVFQADGITAVSGVLVEGTDYITAFTGTPGCVLTITMQSAAAAVAPSERLIVTYEALLDADSPPDTTFTNIAGATAWYSWDTAGDGATGHVRGYTRNLTDGTTSVADHEDAHTITTEAPVISVQKTVINVTSGQNPGADAVPGDTLKYSVTLTNISDFAVASFSLLDELDALATTETWFVPGTLNVTTLPAGADASNTDANGGVNGTGLVDIRSLNLDAAGGVNDSLLIEFEATLAPVITSGTSVLNQAQAVITAYQTLPSDDPNINGADDPYVIGDEDPTATLITSSPVFEVLKTSEDLTDDPTILLAGEVLRYTLTVKNIGSENSVNSLLTDYIPNFTSYVANSTLLNGIAVSDPAAGVSPLEAGMLINAPEDTTPGAMRADSSAIIDNVATITFEVMVNIDAIIGTLISNQGFVTGDGAGSGPFPGIPSDDPGTSTIDDPTINIVGNLPLVDAQKTVEITIDNGTPGFVDPGDTLRYTIITSNLGAKPATGVVLVDTVPANTTYVANSVFLNGLAVNQPDGSVSPLASGIDISSADLTPPLPTSGNGTLTPGQIATVIFDVTVDAGVASGTIISNQGSISNNETPAELTDWDGDDSNGDQPTDVVVGDSQQLSIIKEVLVVGGGALDAGDELEYTITVRNISSVAATNVLLTDDLDSPVAGQMTYVSGSAQLNGSSSGISFAAPVLSADYSSVYGDLLPGETAVLRFRALTNSALAIGTTLTNTGQVAWDAPVNTTTASVSIDIGGIQGFASFNGLLWHDSNFNDLLDVGETPLPGWSVDIYRNATLLATVLTDASGAYSVSGLTPNVGTTDVYRVFFIAPGAGANTAKLGQASSIYTNTNGLQEITDIYLGSGSNVQNVNLPIEPNGVVYNSVLRSPVPGATLTLLQTATGAPLSSGCFDDPAQQGQITLLRGYYKFDVNFSQPDCPSGADYLIQIVEPVSGFTAAPSLIIPPETDAATAAFSVPGCPGGVNDLVPATPDHCEAQILASAPPLSVPARTPGTVYYLNLTLSSGVLPVENQLFNNHIPVDPDLGSAVSVSKTTSMVNVTRSQLVPYTIILNNTFEVPLANIDIVDTFPFGFKYVEGSGQMNGVVTEPSIIGQQLVWPNLVLAPNSRLTIKLLLVVSSGVKEGEYINRAEAINNLTGGNASSVASATVRVIPDPDFDCSDVIGKVFDDQNQNAYQDEDEEGLAEVRVVSARGLTATTDQYGRFHLTCAVVPDETRGSNFILKLDTRTLPTGYRVTTENPRIERTTRGKMAKFSFGASIYSVVRLEMADGVFETDSEDMRPQWNSRLDLLMKQLKAGPSILRLTYLADTEDDDLVEDRLDEVKDDIEDRWQELNCCYELKIETEVFWRNGGPRD